MATTVVLLAATAGLGYWAASATGQRGQAAGASSNATSSADASPQSVPAAPPPRQVLPTAEPSAPAPALLERGRRDPEVRDLQARLRQLDWFEGDVTDTFGPKTVAAVRGFQGKRGLPPTGYVDQVTLDRLTSMSRKPTRGELENRPTDGTWTDAPLDQRCQTGRALCVDKSSRTLRWVVDGRVQRTLAVRFGSQYTPTREGSFSVDSKSPDHVSSLFNTPMPYAMFFSRGQAVHYSPDFAATGYNGASHGCVNVRDRAGIEWLFNQVQVGDRVVVYWS